MLPFRGGICDTPVIWQEKASVRIKSGKKIPFEKCMVVMKTSASFSWLFNYSHFLAFFWGGRGVAMSALGFHRTFG